MDEWICTCGRKNTDKFCQTCGKSREVHEKENYAPPPAPDITALMLNRRRITYTDEGFFHNLTTSFSEFMKSPKEFFFAHKSFFIKAGFFFLFWGLLSGMFTSGNYRIRPSTTAPNQTTHHQIASSNSKTSEENIPTSKLPSKSDMHNVNSDLSLGGICIGDNVDKMHRLLGREDVIRDNQDGYLQYNYPDVEVVVKNNLVEKLVSKTAKVETKRGLHQDCSKQDVVSNYGRDYEMSEYQGNILLEYPFTSLNGKKSLLRFALKNDKVEYISIRTISDYISPTSKQDDAALLVFQRYWDNLNRRNFKGAYDMLTYDQQNYMGEFEDYRHGYDDMIENNLTKVNVLEKSDSTVRISYTLKARDREKGKIIVQIFQGNAIMVKYADSWKINRLEAKLVQSFIE